MVAFTLMKNFVFYQKNCHHYAGMIGAPSTVEQSMEQTKFIV